MSRPLAAQSQTILVIMGRWAPLGRRWAPKARDLSRLPPEAEFQTTVVESRGAARMAWLPPPDAKPL